MRTCADINVRRFGVHHITRGEHDWLPLGRDSLIGRRKPEGFRLVLVVPGPAALGRFGVPAPQTVKAVPHLILVSS